MTDYVPGRLLVAGFPGTDDTSWLVELRQALAELGVTIMVVTHDAAVSGQVSRTVAIRDGRTATEVRRSTRVGADGSEELITEEYAVLDRAGRLQLPAAFVEELALRDRVRDVIAVRLAEADSR